MFETLLPVNDMLNLARKLTHSKNISPCNLANLHLRLRFTYGVHKQYYCKTV